MDNILDEASAFLQCRECPWYKNCVMPMQFSAEDMKRQLKSTMGLAGFPEMPDSEMERLLAGMSAATQSMILEGCPVFIKRIRSSPSLARRLKEIMQNWSAEEGD